MKFSNTFSLIFIVFVLFFTACLDIKEIDFIPFQVDFRAPANIAMGETIRFIPGEGTLGAQSFLWEFGDADSTKSNLKNPEFQFDTLGLFSVKLTARIQKSNGLQEASFSRNILVLPSSDTLSSLVSFGTPNVDDIAQDFFIKNNHQGYLLLGRENVSTLRIQVLDNNLQVLHQGEVANLASGQVFGRAIRQSSDQGILLAGYIQTGIQENDAFLIKLDSTGNMTNSSWQRVVTSIKNEVYNTVLESINNSDTSYLAIGTVVNSGSPTVLIDRYSTDGTLLNSQSFDNQCFNCRANEAILLNNENEQSLIVAGNFTNSPALFRFSFTNQNAQLVGQSIVEIRGEGNKVRQLDDGKFALIGTVNSGSDSTKAFAAKFDVVRESSIPSWVTILDLYQEGFFDITENTEGDLIVFGSHFNPLSQSDFLLTKLNTFSGQIQKVSLKGGKGSESGLRIWNDGTNFILVGSKITDAGFNFRDIVLGQIPIADF